METTYTIPGYTFTSPRLWLRWVRARFADDIARASEVQAYFNTYIADHGNNAAVVRRAVILGNSTPEPRSDGSWVWGWVCWHIREVVGRTALPWEERYAVSVDSRDTLAAWVARLQGTILPRIDALLTSDPYYAGNPQTDPPVPPLDSPASHNADAWDAWMMAYGK